MASVTIKYSYEQVYTSVADKTITVQILAGSDSSGGSKFIDGTDPKDAVYTTGNVGINNNNPLYSDLVIGQGSSHKASSPVVEVLKLIDDSVGENTHCFTDSRNINRNDAATTFSSSSYDGRVKIQGTADTNHYVGVQIYPTYQSTGTINELVGMSASSRIESGNVTKYIGYKVNNPTKIAGNVANVIGILVDRLNIGDDNIGIFTVNDNVFRDGNLIFHKKLGLGNSNKIAFRFGSGYRGTIESAYIEHVALESYKGALRFNMRGSGNMMYIDGEKGNIGIGTELNDVSAILDANSTTKGFLPPRMTTLQRDAITTPASGLMIFNTTANKHQGYNGTAWNDMY